MTVWLVRAGRYGERENLALEQGLSVIGWEELVVWEMMALVAVHKRRATSQAAD